MEPRRTKRVFVIAVAAPHRVSAERAADDVSDHGSGDQGSPLLRFLWGEAAAHAVRRDPELKRFYRRKLVQKVLGKARVAVARKLGIRLWIMLRDEID